MSRILAYIPEALESIWRHRTRSLLSALGMIIGIASVIGVLGLSQAASNGLKAEIASGGDPGFVLLPDNSADNPAAATLYFRDATLLQAYSNGIISRAIPMYGGGGGQGGGYRITVSGKSEFVSVSSVKELTGNEGLVPLSGRLIDAVDVSSAANVCIMSQEAAQKLFPNGDATGKTINVGTQRLTVIGVVGLKASLFRGLVGEAIWVPYTAMHHIARGPVDYIEFWPADRSIASTQVIAAAKSAMRHVHTRGVYTIQDQLQFNTIFGNILSFMGIGLTFIGGASLFVAGVGIMNIMLVSVNERTREIGIRKSIGANAGEIALQFLIEATLLSLAGGLIGTFIGIGLVLLMKPVIIASIGSAPVPWLMVIAIAAGFSLLVGIGFGSYPAVRAGKLDPVEALRS